MHELQMAGLTPEGAAVLDDSILARTASRPGARKLLTRLLIWALALDCLWLARPWWFLPVLNHVGDAAVPLAAALCMIWRSRRLPARESVPWLWFAAAALLWSAAPLSAIFFTTPSLTYDLSLSPSGIFFAAAGLPLLLAVSGTRDTDSSRTVLFLDLGLSAIILALLWVRLYGMGLDNIQMNREMLGIYQGEAALIALAALLRMLTWSTYEERRRIHLFGAAMWMFLPILMGMIYAGQRWHLPPGTILDALWALPFFLAGWQAVHLPISHTPSQERRQLNRAGLVLDSMAPLFIASAGFILAISIARQHPVMAICALGLILVLQSMHAALAQLNVHDGRVLLLERERQLQQANSDLERLSMEDPLTGIANRRRFDAALQDCWKRSARRREDFAILMIDLDHFKSVNDLYGHTYGDECLVEVANVLEQQACRPDDLLARYGGEEFVLMLPDTGRQGAQIVADRLRAAIWSRRIRHEASPFGQRLTVSIGVGTCQAGHGIDPTLLIEVADQALYEAKRQGRNRTCLHALDTPRASE